MQVSISFLKFKNCVAKFYIHTAFLRKISLKTYILRTSTAFWIFFLKMKKYSLPKKETEPFQCCTRKFCILVVKQMRFLLAMFSFMYHHGFRQRGFVYPTSMILYEEKFMILTFSGKITLNLDNCWVSYFAAQLIWFSKPWFTHFYLLCQLHLFFLTQQNLYLCCLLHVF